MSLLWGEMPPIPVQIGPPEEGLPQVTRDELRRNTQIKIAIFQQEEEQAARGESTGSPPIRIQSIAMAKQAYQRRGRDTPETK